MLHQAHTTRGSARAGRLPFSKGTNARRTVVKPCQAVDPARRDVLLTGLASPLIFVRSAGAKEEKYLEVDNLSSFQRSDQRTDFALRAQNTLREFVKPEDAPACVRLALHDAFTYDIATKTGGFDGSIALNSEELSRPENASLKELVDRLKKAKTAIDEGDKVGNGPISWADLIYLAGRVTTQDSWANIKIGRSETESGGKFIATAFKNPWTLEIGRIDSTEPGPNRMPPMDADVATIRAALLKLGAKPDAGSGPFTPKAPFWERPGFTIWTAAAVDPAAEEKRFVEAFPDVYAGVKKDFDISRRSVTRTDYEVDFGNVYNKLCRLGAKFDNKAYLHRERLAF